MNACRVCSRPVPPRKPGPGRNRWYCGGRCQWRAQYARKVLPKARARVGELERIGGFSRGEEGRGVEGDASHAIGTRPPAGVDR